jgi:Family of unknown function (DUF5302)
MTKSAKQDTKEGPAKTAETESAATTDAAATESAATTPAAAAEHAEAGHAEAGHAEAGHAEAGHAEAGHADDDATGDAGKPDIDDVKAKFREALDRKRQVHDEGQGRGGHESGKVSGAHGPAASRRNFRRKSG